MPYRPTKRTEARKAETRERIVAAAIDQLVEAERLIFRRGYGDVLVETLEEGIEKGELEPHDTRTIAAALIGATGEALVGPLSPATENGAGEPLIATLVTFCMDAIPQSTTR